MLRAIHLLNTKEFFEDDEKFKSDRWFSLAMSESRLENMASIPFEYGTRTCIAKELAETQISIVLVKVGIITII